MQTVERKKAVQCVLASLATLELRLLAAQSVSSTASVLQALPVSTFAARTHALEFVESTPSVTLSTTTPSAAVRRDTSVTPSRLVVASLVSTATHAYNPHVCNPITIIHFKIDDERPVTPKPDVCNPNPCGPSATAKSSRGRCTCTCPSGLFGDPYKGCRPECVLNSDCPRKMACSENKCVDPCLGTCGINAKCRVFNHIPTCTCPPGYNGNAFEECSKTRKHVSLTILGLK